MLIKSSIVRVIREGTRGYGNEIPVPVILKEFLIAFYLYGRSKSYLSIGISPNF